MQTIIQLLESILEFIFEFFEVVIKGAAKRKKEYDANFASPTSLLSSRDDGFCITGRRNLSRKLSYQNVIAIGATGTGKSSVLIFPSLFTMNGSYIVNDVSGEILEHTGGFLHSRGYNVLVLNFVNLLISCGFNPIARARTSSEIHKVAHLLVENSLGKKSSDQFWITQATSLISLMITIIKTQEEQYQNLYNVRHLLNQLGANPKKIDRLFTDYSDETLFAEYHSLISYDPKTVSGIVATAKAALQIFADEAVAKVTSFDSINFQDFRTRPTVLFVQNSVADQKYYSGLTSILFEQLFGYLLSRFPKDNEYDVWMLIDECSSLHLPTLPMAVANLRKHRAGTMLLLQDYNQLVHTYGKNNADGIKSNCYMKVYFAGQGHDTAKELEQTLGVFQFEDKDKRKVTRQLMTASEIRMISSKEALIIAGNQPPILARLKPYYERSEFTEYSEMPVPEFPRQVPETLPLLELSVPEHENQ